VGENGEGASVIISLHQKAADYKSYSHCYNEDSKCHSASSARASFRSLSPFRVFASRGAGGNISRRAIVPAVKRLKVFILEPINRLHEERGGVHATRVLNYHQTV